MKSISTLALGVSLALGGMAFAAPASAQAQAEAPAAAPRKFNFSDGARKALSELQQASKAGDPAAFAAKLAAAEAVAKTQDDRYFIAQMRLGAATQANDEAGKRAAIDAIIASGGATQAELPQLYRAQGGLAINAKAYDQGIAAYTKLIELQPNDPEVLTTLIALHRERESYPQAMALTQQAIAAGKAAGKPVSEEIYRLGLQTALDAKMNAQLLPLTREFLAAYPTQKNWATGLDIFRQGVESDQQILIDTFRLMRASKSLERPNEYIALADALAEGRYYAEARDVVNEGVAAGKFPASNASASAILKEVGGKIAEDKAALAGLEGRARSGANGTLALRLVDAYYGHGNHAKAAEFYALAVQKGSVDANLANTRRGMALALAGQKAEAEAALKAVTGPRADLAGLWMLWLSQRS